MSDEGMSVDEIRSVVEERKLIERADSRLFTIIMLFLGLILGGVAGLVIVELSGS